MVTLGAAFQLVQEGEDTVMRLLADIYHRFYLNPSFVLHAAMRAGSTELDGYYLNQPSTVYTYTAMLEVHEDVDPLIKLYELQSSLSSSDLIKLVDIVKYDIRPEHDDRCKYLILCISNEECDEVHDMVERVSGDPSRTIVHYSPAWVLWCVLRNYEAEAEEQARLMAEDNEEAERMFIEYYGQDEEEDGDSSDSEGAVWQAVTAIPLPSTKGPRIE